MCKPFRIINIVDTAARLNSGVWSAAASTALYLKSHDIDSEIWYPELTADAEIPGIKNVPLSGVSTAEAERWKVARSLNPGHDIIVTHGAWRYPTRWGSLYKKAGFKWVYTPQGMLEPWSRSQKKLLKDLYFTGFEKRYVNLSNVIRAVSEMEANNLKKTFIGKSIEIIPNGVEVSVGRSTLKAGVLNFLFLGRLHHKKGVLQLVKAWVQSSLNNSDKYHLLIAGDDHGELAEVKKIINKSTNISYLGFKGGEDKVALYKRCSFFILPTQSEGFASAVVEGMEKGLIPIITKGANFPDVFSRKLGLEIRQDERSIAETLNLVTTWSLDKIQSLSSACQTFVRDQYRLERIADLQRVLYSNLLNRQY